MILADTSVWIELFRRGDRVLQNMLDEGQVLTHEFVLGELACGWLHDRTGILLLHQRGTKK